MKKDMSFDRQVIERFNQELDCLLSTGELPAEIKQDALHNEMLSIANALATANIETLSKGRVSLRNRLLSNEASLAHQPTPRAMKMVTIPALALVLLITLFAVSPTLRSWAQEVLARVGNLIITDAPTDAEQRLPRLLTATPEFAETALAPPESLSQEEASLRAGFTVLLPRDIPKGEDIYAVPWGIPWKDRWNICAGPNWVFVAGVYDRWYGVHILQLKLPDEQIKDFPIGDADIVEVAVRGQTGYWIEETATGMTQLGVVGSLKVPDPDWQIAYENILTWEEEGIVYLIQADDELSLDALLTIAESLAP
jgi:hypothetical protein